MSNEDVKTPRVFIIRHGMKPHLNGMDSLMRLLNTGVVHLDPS